MVRNVISFLIICLLLSLYLYLYIYIYIQVIDHMDSRYFLGVSFGRMTLISCVR